MEDSSLGGLCERFMYDVREYLESRLVNAPDFIIIDISTYIANRFGVSVVDILNERDSEWRRFCESLGIDICGGQIGGDESNGNL